MDCVVHGFTQSRTWLSDLHLYVLSCFNYFLTHPPGGSDDKASAYNVGDLGSVPGLGRSPGEGNANPCQYSCLENPMDGGAQQAIVHVLAKSQTRLNDFTFTFTFYVHYDFPMAQWQRILLLLQEPQETWIIFLSLEDPLEEEMAAHASILSRVISRTEQPGGLHPWGHKKLDRTEATEHTSTLYPYAS